MIDTSQPNPENAEQATFVLVTRCGHAQPAPGRMKAQASAPRSLPGNTGLLPTTHLVYAPQAIIKTNMQHRLPVNRAHLATPAPHQAYSLWHVLQEQSRPSFAK
jgi:hypothetical protein